MYNDQHFPLSVLRWKLCWCRVQVQRQHLLQWSSARCNPRCELSSAPVDVFFSSHLLWPRLITVIQCHHHQLPCACSLHRVCSQRTKRSWSTTPSWPFYLRRLSCLRWTLSWRAISRPFAVWWPPRLVSRPSPSCLSKDAGHVLLHLLTC